MMSPASLAAAALLSTSTTALHVSSSSSSLQSGRQAPTAGGWSRLATAVLHSKEGLTTNHSSCLQPPATEDWLCSHSNSDNDIGISDCIFQVLAHSQSSAHFLCTLPGLANLPAPQTHLCRGGGGGGGGLLLAQRATGEASSTTAAIADLSEGLVDT